MKNAQEFVGIEVQRAQSQKYNYQRRPVAVALLRGICSQCHMSSFLQDITWLLL